MFLDEARLAARLNHPHVVQTYEVGEYMGRPVIVMEYLEGQVLSSLVQRAQSTNALSLTLHLRVIIDALEGLHHAHELADYDGKPLNLVHRDISPQNVFVTFEGQVKVLDFGIAKAATSQSETATGILKGKVKYMAPEQMLNLSLDRRADIYAVGVLVWEAATGQRMWKGASDIHVMNAVVNEGAQSLREINPEVDPDLEKIVQKALARDPDERYATALDLAGALEAFVEQTTSGGSTKALGKVMRQLFEDERKRTRGIIEAQLKEAEAAASDPHLIPPNIVRLSSRAPGIEESPAPGTGSNAVTKSAETPAIPVRAPVRRGLVVAALSALALGGAAVGFLARGGASTPTTVASAPPPSAVPAAAPVEPPPAPTVAPPPAVPALSKEVSLEISTTPKRAIVFLDGQRLASNPYKGSLVREGAPHKLRAEAPGFVTRTIDIVPDRDLDVVVALDALPSRGVGRPQGTAAASASASAPAKNCNPPYYIDTDGIKKFKPECL
jgi:serine/threonine-protein kinase